ncbi:MAG: TonB-dependent receptor [Bacteroidota bacterium]
MNVRILVLYVVLILVANDLHAQTETGTISGKIIDGAKPLEAATVGLYTAKDSLLAKTTLSGTDGSFVFDRLKFGNYYIVASMSGFNKYKTGELLLNRDYASLVQDPFVLKQQEGRLQNVTVTAQKSMIERKVDRTVVNVDAMISAAGSTALDVLEKSLGVSVDQNGVISLKGRAGVTIFIDDKPTYLSGTDLENYLRSLPASTIDQIELMTNPPAKYDAAGGAGVINIRTKRTRVRGFNGSLNVAYTQGRYGKTNNSFNFNYRNNKWNSFGTFTYNTGNNFSDLDIDRHFKNADGSRKYDFLQHTYIRPVASALSAKLGADYYATAKTTFGMVLTGVTRTGKRNNDNESRILNTAFQLDSAIVAYNKQDNIFAMVASTLITGTNMRKAARN